jgi:methyl-accepting chemotaxis protein
LYHYADHTWSRSRYTSYNSAKSELQQKLEETANSNVKLLNQTIDQIIQLEIANMKQLSLQITSVQIDKKDAQVQKLIEDFMKQHLELEVLTLGNNNGAWMKAPDPGKQEYDPRTRDWYKELLKAPGKASVSDPLISATTKNVVVIVGITLPDGKGAIGVNLSLSKLNEIVKEVKFGSEGYAYMLDRTNIYLAHPNRKLGELATGDQFQTIQEHNSGTVTYTMEDGKIRKAFYTTNEQTGWKIVSVLMTNEYSQSAQPILMQTAIVLISATLLAMVILTFVINSITRPIEQLAVSATRVSEGYLDEKVITKRSDEIGVLAHNYNAMVDSLRSIIMEMAATSSQLAASSQEMAASTEENAKAVEHVNELVQESSKAAESQAIASGESARTMEEMAAGIIKIAESANTIVDSSSQTAVDVETGSEKVKHVTEHRGIPRHNRNFLLLCFLSIAYFSFPLTIVKFIDYLVRILHD